MCENTNDNEYTPDLDKVIESEKEYIERRREAVDKDSEDKTKSIPSGLSLPVVSEDNLWGIALSGGGIRSATFALGVIQGLTRRSKKFSKGLFRRFDYLSTVSGGGYIGACLSSLLADDQTVGVDHDNSPFVGLNADVKDTTADATKNSVRHQLHHLRSKGNYLAGSRKLLSFEFQRFGGTAVFGALHNIVLFSIIFIALVAIMHWGLSAFGGGTIDGVSPRISYSCNEQIIDTVRPISDSVRKSLGKFGYTIYAEDFSVSSWESLTLHLSAFYREALAIPICKLWCSAGGCFRGERFHWVYYLGAIIGSLWTLGFIFYGIYFKAKKCDIEAKNAPTDMKSGLSILEKHQYKFINWYNWVSTIIITICTISAALYFTSEDSDSVPAIFLPLAFAIGSGTMAFFASAIFETVTGETYRIRRSFLAAIKGGTLLGIIISLAVPHILVLVFAVSHFSFMSFASVMFFVISAVLFGKGKGITAGIPSSFWAKHFKLLLNISMVLTILLSITPATHLLVRHLYPLVHIDGLPWQLVPLLWVVMLGILICLMSFIDANRLSPFNFYRDRLTEAYLQTFASVKRSPAEDKQGKAMKLVSDREKMFLTDLSIKNTKGPYHLFTASMNVSGSNELLRKDTKSEHFLFSPKYVGSKSTGYIATCKYHGSKLRLSRAMAVAGAASSSGMGIYSFAAQSFFTTLFNIRLGQWMNNPWWYHNRKPLKRNKALFAKLRFRQLARIVFGKKRIFYRHIFSRPKPLFWLIYHLREIFGMTNANTGWVLLSDGGHTGDNLGLLPLLYRRCGVIVVSDADKDDKYTFDSFNNAVRMANIEENITIDIDLTPITLSTELKEMQSKQSVAFGLIHYPPKEGEQCGKTGLLVYLKASVSEWDPSNLNNMEWIAQIDKLKKCIPNALPEESEMNMSDCCEDDWHIPAHVENYNRKNEHFPHESTGDQFYDPEQFEAYRALGEHVARQAVRVFEQLA